MVSKIKDGNRVTWLIFSFFCYMQFGNLFCNMSGTTTLLHAYRFVNGSRCNAKTDSIEYRLGNTEKLKKLRIEVFPKLFSVHTWKMKQNGLDELIK